MKKLHYLLTHAYCWLALAIAVYYVNDQIAYQHAAIRVMAAQVGAIAGIGHGNLN